MSVSFPYTARMSKPGMPPLLTSVLESEGLGTPYMGAFAVEARPPQYAEPAKPIEPRVAAKLSEIGIEQLFTHQAHAIDRVREGKSVVVVTGTNSGKSLCYMVPAMERLAEEPMARILTVYPTKALAQDQLARFERLRPFENIRCAVYDGDTPQAQRSPIRRLAQVVLTNPDMLHVGILPGHERWARFFKSLRLIVLDEMHVYRGVFGSHVGGIVRRLLRLAQWYGSRPAIVGCTATIGNPDEMFRRLTGREAEVIDEDGSGQPRKTYAFWNPAAVSGNESPSPNWLSARLMARMAAQGKSSLVFCRSRIGAELVVRYGREVAEQVGIDPRRLDSYRSGYTAAERRKLEKAVHEGKLLGLACTNALELGVDIGALDAVVLNGYPGSVAGFRQQCGRSGRGAREGLAVFVAHEDPLEQFFLREPSALIHGLAEPVALNPENRNILEPQLRCAAYERPLDASELEAFGPNALETAEAMDRSGELAFQGGRFFYPFHEAPASKVDIRGAGGDQVVLMAEGEELGSMEQWRAKQYAHEGAVYLHRGEAFQVAKLDLSQSVATLEPFSGDYFTQPVHQTVIESLVTVDERSFGGLAVRLGSVRITDMILGYQKKALAGGKVLDTVDLNFPPASFETLAMRVDLPAPRDEDEWPLLAPEVHALEHALSAVAPLIAGCDRSDLGSAWYVAFPDSMAPAVFLYDRFSGGMGLSEALYRSAEALFATAQRALSGCGCGHGCPKCLYNAGCEIGNETLSKAGAQKWLERLAPRETDYFN